MATLLIMASVILIAGGIWLLRTAWLRGSKGNPIFVYAGWGVITTGTVLMGLATGFEVGIPFAITAAMVIAMIAVIGTMRVSTRKRSADRSERIDPEIRPKRRFRALLRGILAILVSGIAALGAGVMMATSLPMIEINRIVMAGLCIPLFWGAAMAWALSDPKLIRPGIGLVGSASLFGLIAFL